MFVGSDFNAALLLTSCVDLSKFFFFLISLTLNFVFKVWIIFYVQDCYKESET